MTAPGALAGFIGAVPEGGREQTVWTPEFILDRVDRVFPDGWRDVFLSEGSPATRRGPFPGPGGSGCVDAYDTMPWAHRNFSNPPYDDLEAALKRARAEWDEYDNQSIQLVPVRTHRAWFAANVQGAAVAYLKPFAFLDSRTGKPYTTTCKRTGRVSISQFPAPMCAIHLGDRKAAFALAFADISHHIQESF